MDDILIGNDYQAGKLWLRESHLQAITEAVVASSIRGLAYLSDGRVVVAFDQNGGTVQIRNADLSIAGSRTGFGDITALAVQSDDSIIVGVSASNGTLLKFDSALNTIAQKTNFGGAIQAIAIQSTDHVVVASDYQNGTVWRVDAALSSSTSVSGFDGGGVISCLAVKSNDDIVVGSDYFSGETNYGQVWIRRATDLGHVARFINFGGAITALAVQSDDHILIASDYLNGKLWRSDPLLTTFDGVPGFGYIRSLAIQSNDQIIVASDYGQGTVWLLDPSLATIGNVVNFGGTIRHVAVDPSPGYSEPAVCGDWGTVYLPADMNQDCYVTIADLVGLAAHWLEGPIPGMEADLNGAAGLPDNYVNIHDLYAWCEQWLWCSDPANPQCDHYYGRDFYDDRLNVANAAHFAVVSVSSKTRLHYANRAGNLIDNDAATFWHAGDPGSQWLEINWKFPRYITEVCLEEVPAAGRRSYQFLGKIAGTISDDWHSLGWGQKVTTSKIKAIFPVQPLKAIRVIVTPENEADVVGVREIKAYTDADHDVQDLQWHAPWIWKNDGVVSTYPDTAAQNGNRYFRYNFSVSNFANVSHAKLVAATKGTAEIYVNGFYLTTINSSSVSPGILVNFRNYLHTGANTIAIKASHSAGTWAGLAVEGALESAGSGALVFSTNSGWKASFTEFTGWKDRLYDDSAWQSPDTIALPYSTPAINYWEVGYETAYHFPGIEEQVNLLNLTLPAVCTPGTWVEITATVSAAAAIQKDYAFVLKGGLDSDYELDDYRLIESFVQPELATNAWIVGQEYEIVFPIWIPEYAPPGETIPLELYGTGGASKLTVAGQTPNLVIAGSNTIPPLGQRVAAMGLKGEKSCFLYNGRELSGRHTYINNRTFENLYNMVQAGYELFSVGSFPQCLVDAPANEDANIDKCFNMIDRQCRLIAAYNPNALFMVALIFRTTPEFIAQYSGECVELPDGRLMYTSTASQIYQQACFRITEKLLPRLNAQPYADRIIGYEVWGQEDGSWRWWGYDQGTWADRDNVFIGADVSDVTVTAFRQWLAEKYVTEANLQSTWNDPMVSFATASVRLDLRQMDYGSAFMNPLQCQPWIDYVDFRNDIAYNLRTAISAQIKDFYHDQIFVQQLSTAMDFGIFTPAPELIGNGDQYQLCANTDIDSLGQNSSYVFRRRDNHYFPQPYYGSLRVHHKVAYSELDNRTHLAAALEDYKEYSEAGSIEVERLAFGADLCMGIVERRLNFDMGRRGQSTALFTGSPAFHQELHNYSELEEFADAAPWYSDKEIAVFISHKTPAYMDLVSPLATYNAYFGVVLNELNFVGAPYDVFHIEDVGNVNVRDNYKLYVFVNAEVLSQQQIDLIDQNLKRDGKTLLWLWAPGYVDENAGFLPGRVQGVTGIAPAIETADILPKIIVDGSSSLSDNFLWPSFQILTAYANNGWFAQTYNPHFYITDPAPTIEAAGYYSYNTGNRALVIKRFGSWNSVFCGIPYIPREILRNIAHEAGVHLYLPDSSDTGDAYLNACRDWLLLHNLSPDTNTVSVTLPRVTEFYDVFNKTVIASQTDQALMVLKPYETKLIYTGYNDRTPLELLTWP